MIGNDQLLWKQEFQEIDQHLDAIGVALDWKISETDRENAYEDMIGVIRDAQEQLALGQPFKIGSSGELMANTKVYEAEKSVSFLRIFVESVTDGPDSIFLNWKAVLPDSMRPSKANGEVSQEGLVYDWRLGIPHLLMLNALRFQVIAAVDQNFLSDGAFKGEFNDHRLALQDQLQKIKSGVRCAIRNDTNCTEDGGGNTICTESYSTVCADVFSGIAASSIASAYDPIDPGWYQTNVVNALEPLRRQVLVQLPLFDVQAMIDTLALYESGAYDLTKQ